MLSPWSPCQVAIQVPQYATCWEVVAKTSTISRKSTGDLDGWNCDHLHLFDGWNCDRLHLVEIVTVFICVCVSNFLSGLSSVAKVIFWDVNCLSASSAFLPFLRKMRKNLFYCEFLVYYFPAQFYIILRYHLSMTIVNLENKIKV